jgi:hypothetical protein
MAAPCRAVVDEETGDLSIQLSPPLLRELVRARYVDGRDFHSRVDVPHKSLKDEAYRKIKRPLVAILEAILGDLEERGLCSRQDAKRIRDVLEEEYGIYPTFDVENRDRLILERSIRYSCAQRLYGIRPLRSIQDVECMEVRPTWRRLAELSVSTEPQSERIEALAQRALEHGVREEVVVAF